MIALVEIFKDNGPAHTPDFKYIAIEGNLSEIDSQLMEIIDGLYKSESIFSVRFGNRSIEMWVDSRYFL